MPFLKNIKWNKSPLGIACLVALIVLIVVEVFVGVYVASYILENGNPFALSQPAPYNTTIPADFYFANDTKNFVAVYLTFKTTGGDLIANNPINLDISENFTEPENTTHILFMQLFIQDAIDATSNPSAPSTFAIGYSPSQVGNETSVTMHNRPMYFSFEGNYGIFVTVVFINRTLVNLTPEPPVYVQVQPHSALNDQKSASLQDALTFALLFFEIFGSFAVGAALLVRVFPRLRNS